MVVPPGTLQDGGPPDPGAVHVVHVIARLNDGGPVRVLAALLPALHRHGIRSTVLCGACAPDESERSDWLRAQGVAVERIVGLGRRVSLPDDWRAFVHLRRNLRHLRPDLVHTHTAKAGLLGRLACRLDHIPCLHTYHGHVLDGYFSHPLTVALARLEQVVAANHHHHGLTPTQMLDLSRCFRIGRPTTWHSLPVPVVPVRPQTDAAWSWALRRRTPVIGFLGRLVPVKDVDLYLATLAELSHHRPVQGLICGDGPLREHAEFRAAELGLRVHFTGFVPAGEALAQMDVLLMTSRNEGQPLAAIEAAGAGVPVVAPPVGGLDDLIRWGGVDGAERTPAALAEAVERLISDPEHRRRRVVAGRRLAARLTPEALAPRYAALYRAIAGVLLLLVVTCLPASALELVPAFAAAATGDLLTWDIRDIPPAWQVTDVTRTPRLVIRAPDGRIMRRPAFVIEGGGLRVRHVARIPGRHTWTMQDPAGDPVLSGAVEIAPGTAPAGPLRISRDNPRFLAWADGTPFVPIGPNVAWIHGDPVAGYEQAFATMAANGCTHTRIWMCSWNLGLEGEQPGAYRLDRAEQLDAVLAAARRHRVVVTLVLDNHHDVIEGRSFPYGRSIPERQDAFFAVPPTPAYAARIRYCLARWGADDAIAAWELMNEPDLALPVRERVIPWIAAAAGVLAETDRDHRLHTVSWCGDDWERALTSPAIDLVHLHRYVLEFLNEDPAARAATRDGVGMLIPLAATANGFGRPWLLGESGFQGTNAENPGNDRDADGFLLRQQLWAGFLLGGCGGAMNWWWDVYLDPQRLWHLYRPFGDIVAHLDLRDPNLVPIAPNAEGPVRLLGLVSPRQGLLMPQVRDDTWFRHLGEGRPRPVPTLAQTIRLGGFRRDGGYLLTAYDPLTGIADPGVPLRADAAGALLFTVPPGRLDLVWHLRLTDPEAE